MYKYSNSCCTKVQICTCTYKFVHLYTRVAPTCTNVQICTFVHLYSTCCTKRVQMYKYKFVRTNGEVLICTAICTQPVAPNFWTIVHLYLCTFVFVLVIHLEYKASTHGTPNANFIFKNFFINFFVFLISLRLYDCRQE